MSNTQTPTPQTQPPRPEKPRATPVPHVDVLKAHITVLIPVDVQNFDTVKAANDVVAKLAESVKASKGHVAVEASLGRAKGDLFP